MVHSSNSLCNINCGIFYAIIYLCLFLWMHLLIFVMEMMKWIHEAYVNGKLIYYAQKKSGINDGINFINGQQIKQINSILNSAFLSFSFFQLFFLISYTARFNLILGLLIFKEIFLCFWYCSTSLCLNELI